MAGMLYQYLFVFGMFFILLKLWSAAKPLRSEISVVD